MSQNSASLETLVAEVEFGCIGRVASPPRLESTSEEFYFWVERDKLVEKTQIVRTQSTIGGREYIFYAVVEEVTRMSRKRDIGEEYDRHDGQSSYEPELLIEGVTYACAKILRSDPEVLTPPLEGSKVFLGGEKEAEFAFGFGEMKEPVAFGLLRNGGDDFAGLASMDCDYLLGNVAGHLNINGMTGAGTKTSFITILLKVLLHHARFKAQRMHLCPIILNVKGEDLMWINHGNAEFDDEVDGEIWRQLGVPATPFADAKFFSPARRGEKSAPSIDGCNATAYCWSLKDVLAAQLFPFLFDERSRSDMMEALALDIVAYLTKEDDRSLRESGETWATDEEGRAIPRVPQKWGEFDRWLAHHCHSKDEVRCIKMHQTSTWRGLYRRVREVLTEGGGLFPRDDFDGNPLSVALGRTCDPLVVDINALLPSLQRFIVAAVVRQVVQAKLTAQKSDVRYLIVLDELNRFAPREGKDPITRILKEVALERRALGIILLGAQQFASQVAPEIIESAAVRALGRTGPGELDNRLWSSWSQPYKRQAAALKPEDKLVIIPTFRQPMLVKMPRPAWALKASQRAANRPTTEEYDEDGDA